TDLVDADTLSALQARLRTLNPGARQLQPQVGQIAAAELLDAGLFKPGEKMPDVARWLNEEAFAEKEAHAHHAHHHHGHGH
ncbi:hypothetical protein ABTJ92_22100, partial [Acinetobacter baumannii]